MQKKEPTVEIKLRLPFVYHKRIITLKNKKDTVSVNQYIVDATAEKLDKVKE